jgi:hypothetical protein
MVAAAGEGRVGSSLTIYEGIPANGLPIHASSFLARWLKGRCRTRLSRSGDGGFGGGCCLCAVLAAVEADLFQGAIDLFEGLLTKV